MYLAHYLQLSARNHRGTEYRGSFLLKLILVFGIASKEGGANTRLRKFTIIWWGISSLREICECENHSLSEWKLDSSHLHNGSHCDHHHIYTDLAVISILTSFAFKVSVVGRYCKRGAVGKTHCSVVNVKPHALFALFCQTSPQMHHPETELHFLFPPTLGLSRLSFFLQTALFELWWVLETVTESPSQFHSGHPAAPHDTPSQWGSLEQGGCRKKWPFSWRGRFSMWVPPSGLMWKSVIHSFNQLDNSKRSDLSAIWIPSVFVCVFTMRNTSKAKQTIFI